MTTLRHVLGVSLLALAGLATFASLPAQAQVPPSAAEATAYTGLHAAALGG